MMTSMPPVKTTAKQLLITGSTGFVGRNLLIHALKDPSWSQIILPVRNPKKLLEQLHQDHLQGYLDRLHLCTVSKNTWNLEGIEDLDLAIHCAGLTFSRDRDPYFATHVEGSLHLLESLPKHSRLLVLSSQSAAGPSSKIIPIRRENHLEKPLTWYGKSKLAMEKNLSLLAYERLLILRPPMILGPRDTATVPLFNMAKGRVRFKPGFKKKEYSWIAVDDLCDAILLAARNDWSSLPQRCYFLAHPKTLTDIALLKTTAEIIHASGITLPLPHALIRCISRVADLVPTLREALPSLGRDRVKEIFEQRWVIDGKPFERDFQWKAQKDLRETLQETAIWLERNRSSKSKSQ
ncbi:MAG: NAD(P)-dependent oxidoreductase [Verrucomicrobiae bacterium]|jgi:nucleoside-diphosphate-sugar epimerase|nr:NAD(P)-dependent oxidoreductase [Verrucomicrobiae bacterium]